MKRKPITDCFRQYSLRKLIARFEKAAQELAGEVCSSHIEDCRLTTHHLASVLAISEEDVVEKLSEISGIPVCGTTEAFSIPALPLTMTFPDLCQCGAVPILHQGHVVAVAVCHPKLLRQHPAWLGIPIALATWSNIRHALTQSQQALENTYQDVECCKPDLPFLRSMISELQSQVESFHGHSCTLSRKSSPLTYSLTTSNNQQAVGALDDSLRSQVDWLFSHSESLEGMLGVLLTHTGDDELRVDWPDLTKEADVPDLTAQSQSDAPSTKRPAHQRGSSLKQILIVDDDPVFAQVLERFLERHGLTSCIADSTVLAMEYLKERSISLVITDMHMPQESGIAFVERLRKNQAWSLLPVFMLTSDESQELALQALHEGADLFFRKSDDPRLLCAHVVRTLAREDLRSAA